MLGVLRSLSHDKLSICCQSRQLIDNKGSELAISVHQSHYIIENKPLDRNHGHKIEYDKMS
jgi:hypothetical protein